eukprot:scaffold55942_cov19-Tisochrysis_lutea.AAC.3
MPCTAHSMLACDHIALMIRLCLVTVASVVKMRNAKSGLYILAAIGAASAARNADAWGRWGLVVLEPMPYAVEPAAGCAAESVVVRSAVQSAVGAQSGMQTMAGVKGEELTNEHMDYLRALLR